ncbi:MAG: DUF3592 domain-containing protein [Anaerolineae bacterium]|nr:DUF3592 domain-containing protein [Anaerolineae bacterium]
MSRWLNSRPFFWPVLLFILLISAPFLGVGLYEMGQSRRIVREYAAATGTVVGNSYSVDDEGGGAYYPVVEFKPNDGRPVQFTSGIGSSPPDYQEGEQVAVLYDPENPRQAYINSWKRLWFAPTLFIAIGLLPLIIGLAILWKIG